MIALATKPETAVPNAAEVCIALGNMEGQSASLVELRRVLALAIKSDPNRQRPATDWRAKVVHRLVTTQRADGSWGEDPNGGEKNVLATACSLLMIHLIETTRDSEGRDDIARPRQSATLASSASPR